MARLPKARPVIEPAAIARYRRLREVLAADPAGGWLECLDAYEAGAPLDRALRITGDPARYSRNGRHGMRLADRDTALRSLADHTPGSTWSKSATVAGWLARAARGDPLHDLPLAVVELLAGIEALSSRQVHRVLTGDRSA